RAARLDRNLDEDAPVLADEPGQRAEDLSVVRDVFEHVADHDDRVSSRAEPAVYVLFVVEVDENVGEWRTKVRRGIADVGAPSKGFLERLLGREVEHTVARLERLREVEPHEAL